MKAIRFLLLASSTLLLASSPDVSAQALWTEGHGDIGMGYENEGGGFEVHPHWHIEGGTVDGTPRADEEFDADALQLVVPDSPNARAVRNSSASWDPIGVAAGETYWRLSQNSQAGVPYVGWATEELQVADWEGDLTFSLTGLTAPGDISVYYFPEGNLTFLWASSDGITFADAFQLSPGLHEHYNIAFSAPGVYEVEITMSGTRAGGDFQSATETFVFNVVPEPSTCLLVAASLGTLALSRFRR